MQLNRSRSIRRLWDRLRALRWTLVAVGGFAATACGGVASSPAGAVPAATVPLRSTGSNSCPMMSPPRGGR